MERFAGLAKYFTPENNWTIIPIASDDVDLRDAKQGDSLRCMDRRFGIKPDGTYDPEIISRAPAVPGALDGISAFMEGNSEERHSKAAALVEESGFKPADHGDIVGGDIKGCKFREALLEGKIPGLKSLTIEETRVLRSKIGVEHITLNNTDRHPLGFLLNPNMQTVVLPNNAMYYPIEIWYLDYLGIEPEKFLPVIEKCGQLLLPEEKRLYIVSH